MTHDNNCGCMQGYHIWDEDSDDNKKEKFCICCEHFFPNDDTEQAAVEAAIEFPGKSSKKPPENKSGGNMRKGKIVRRG